MVVDRDGDGDRAKQRCGRGQEGSVAVVGSARLASTTRHIHLIDALETSIIN